MNINMSGLLENLLKKDFHHTIDIVLEGGCMNGAYELGGLMLIKALEKNGKVTIRRLSGASVGSFVSLLYLTDQLECYVKNYKDWREDFNNTVKLHKFKNLVMDICTKMTDKVFKSLQRSKIFITYYDIKTKKCILKKEYSSREELAESILKSCHLPYLINGDPFYKTAEGEYLDGGLPYIFKLQKDTKILYMKLTRHDKLHNIFNVAGEISIDGRILEGLLDTYNFLMNEKPTDMCSFVNNWGFLSLIRYNSVSYIYWIGVYLFAYFYKIQIENLNL